MTGRTSIASVGLWRNERHQYWANYGVQVGPIPSVTTIGKTLGEKTDGLVGGARKQTAAYAVANLAQIQKLVGEFSIEAAVAHVASENAREWAAKGARGTTVHALIEAQLRHRFSHEQPAGPHIADEFAPDMKALDNFLDDFPLTVLGAETMVVNFTQEYAGTVDLWAQIAGEVWLIDVKTGKWLGEDFILQLSAYAFAENIGRPEDPKRYKVPKATRFGVLHIRPDDYPRGYQLIPYSITEQDWRAFLHIRETHRWLNQRAPMVKGAPLTPKTLEVAA